MKHFRYDIDDSNRHNLEPSIRLFRWGYVLHESRWWPYWIVRLPGLSWQRDWYKHGEFGWHKPLLLWSRCPSMLGCGFQMIYERVKWSEALKL